MIDRFGVWTVDRPWFSLLVVGVLSLAALIGYVDPKWPQRTLFGDTVAATTSETRRGSDARPSSGIARPSSGNALNVTRGDAVLVVESEHFFSAEGAAAMRAVAERLEALDYVRRVVWMDQLPPLNIFGLPEPLFPRGTASPMRYEEAKKRALKHPLIVGQLLSPDAKTAVMLVHFDWLFVRDDADCIENLLAQARDAASPFPQVNLQFSITGSVPIRLTAMQQHEANELKYQLIGYSMVVVMALVLFRGLAAVIIIALSTSLGVIWTLGILRFFDLQENPFNDVVLPVMLSLVGLTDGVHLLVQIRRHRSSGMSAVESARRGVAEVGVACFLTAITTSIGFGSLGLAHHRIVREFGLSCVLGVFLTFTSVMGVIPLACRTWLGHRVHAGQEKSLIDRNLAKIGGLIEWVMRHRRTVAWSGIIGTFVMALIGFTLRPDERSSRILPEGSEPAVALQKLDRALGGLESSTVEIHWDPSVPADSPQVLAVVQEVDTLLRSEPLLSHPISLLQLLNALPGEGDGADRMSLLDLLPPPLKLAFYSPEQHQATVQFRVQDLGIARYGPVFERLEKGVAQIQAAHPGFTCELSGSAIWRWENLYQIVLDLFSSLGSEAVIIFGVMMVAYRSIRLGLISIIPNAFPLAVAAVYMVITGQPLEVVSVCSFTICLGIAVDDTIHFLTRYQEECLIDQTRDDAIRHSFANAGTGMIMTTVILVAGFSTVLFSGLRDHQIFAKMGAITIIAAFFGDLVLLPALLACYGPQPGVGSGTSDRK